MFGGILWIIGGIVIIIINASSETSELVIKGTEIDFGYLAIIVGLFSFFWGLGKRSEKKEAIKELEDSLKNVEDETKTKLINGTHANDVVDWLEKEKNISREVAIEFVKELSKVLKT